MGSEHRQRFRDANAKPSAEAEETARRFQDGDRRAAEEVGRRVARIVSARGYGFTTEDQHDIEQEVMTQVWQTVQGPGFDPSLGFFRFLEVVTTRRCIDWLRSRRDSAPLDPEMPSTGPDPMHDSLARERRELALAALGRLGQDCRQLIYLHTGLGKSYREISIILGTSEGALRVRLHRCIRKAQELMAETETTGE